MQYKKKAESSSTISKAFHVLEVVAQSDFPMRFSDILSAVPYPKSTLHRLLKILQEERMLRLTESTHRFAVGYRLMQLAHKSWNQASLKDAAAIPMTQLNHVTRETVHLAVLEGYQVLYVEKRESERALNIYSSVGKLSPAYCTGLGKAMLAFLPEFEITRALQAQSFERHTSKTITDAKKLMAELIDIRDRGYAFDLEEHEDDIQCIAVPILSKSGSLLGGLSVTAPTYRVDSAQLADWADIVCEAAQQISDAAGIMLPPQATEKNSLSQAI